MRNKISLKIPQPHLNAQHMNGVRAETVERFGQKLHLSITQSSNRLLRERHSQLEKVGLAVLVTDTDTTMSKNIFNVYFNKGQSSYSYQNYFNGRRQAK